MVSGSGQGPHEIPDEQWFELRESLAQPAGPGPSVPFAVGSKVRVKDGHLRGIEGTVDQVFPNSGGIRVKIMVFGRSTPVELDCRQVESAS